MESNITINNDYYSLLSENTNELVFILDKYGQFKTTNRLFEEKLKFGSDELLGKHFFEIITEKFKVKAGKAFQQLISDQIESEFRSEIIPKIGLEQLYEIKLIPILVDSELNEVLGIGININEITEQKKKNIELHEKLKEANRINAIERDRANQQISVLSELNNLKNEFISNVSHELRTPLASIIGFSETILEDNNIDVEKSKEFNNIILNESKRLAKLIDDVLDFSELESEKRTLQKSRVDIISMLKEIIDEYKEECRVKNITLTNNLPESSIEIYADHDRIYKALSYIMSNAYKFTNEEGRITVLSNEFLKEVEIIISDTGVGIDEQKLPLLFNKFSKIKHSENNDLPGAGFGLVTVKQIIDLHKGLIKVKSEVNKGTSFIIRLPKYSYN
jgi:PAS domain S-box-containing protein